MERNIKEFLIAFGLSSVTKITTKRALLSFAVGLAPKRDKSAIAGSFLGSLVTFNSALPEVKENNVIKFVDSGERTNILFNGVNVSFEQFLELLEKAKKTTIFFDFGDTNNTSTIVLAQNSLDLLGIQQRLTSTAESVAKINSKEDLILLSRRVL